MDLAQGVEPRRSGSSASPARLRLFLVYDGSTRRAELERQFQTILIKQEETIKNQDDLLHKMDAMIRVSVRSCSNAARDEEARARCFDP